MFTRKKITIPAAGESEIFAFDGVSLIIESMPTYSTPEQVPTLGFGDISASPQPLYPQSVYVAGGGFDRIAIKGTSESAGDSIYILSTDQCLQEEINNNTFNSSRATIKPTFSVLCDDTVMSLSAGQIVNSDSEQPGSMYITSRGGSVAYAFQEDPEQADGLGHVLNENETQEIIGVNLISNFRFLSAVSGETPEITFTMVY